MPKAIRLPPRSKVPAADTWDLSSLCESDEEWEKLFARLDKLIPGYEKFRGKLGDGATAVAECLAFDSNFERLAERVGGYAHLKMTEDQADSKYQGMVARLQNLSTRASQSSSYILPELLALPQEKLAAYLAAAELKPYK